MKKRLLIINKSFELGGIQVALINMLEAIHASYDVTLAIFNPRGPLLERIPNDVKLLKLSPLVQVLGMNNSDCMLYGTKLQKVFKVLGGVWAKLFGNSVPVKIALASQKNVGEYDVVISYHQETSSKTLVTGFGEFALKKCNSLHKIAWIHADFLATKLGTRKNRRIYKRFDQIVSVSKTTMDSFNKTYPDLSGKSVYCYNYLPETRIIEKSMEKSSVFDRKPDDIIMLSVGRISEEKGILVAAQKLKLIFQSNSNMKWYIVGDGVQRKQLSDFIFENKLENSIFLLGFKDNPYPYIREADYLFVPSLHETFGMVVSEAHILGTNVIGSDIPIMKEILRETDFIWDSTVDGFPKLTHRDSSVSFIAENSKDIFLESFSKLINGGLRND